MTEQFPRNSQEDHNRGFPFPETGLGAQIEPDSMREQDAYILKFSVEGATTAIRIKFNDYSGSDLVITNMTTLPDDKKGSGYGTAAIQQLISWAKENQLSTIRAAQVQRASEGFWTKNGFVKAEEPNPTNDYLYQD
jgi:uncharacterized protein YjdB